MLLLTALVWTAAFANGARAYEVRLSERRAGDVLSGVVGDGEDSWSFDVRARAGRAVEFRRGSRLVAQLTADDGDRSARVRLGTATWSTTDDGSRAAARAEIDDETAIAIRDAAIQLATLAPAPEDRLLRLTVLQLYAEVANVVPESRPRGAAGRKLTAGRSAAPRKGEAVCETYTQDALFDCRDEEGEIAVVPFIDDVRIASQQLRHHQPDHCYGACGPSCGGKCIEVPVACTEPFASPTTGSLCYAPYPEVGKLYRPSDDFDTSLERCPADGTPRGTVTVCTAAPCCFAHDECNRHDREKSLWAYLKCQMWGLRECGFSAVFGVPKTAWELKWFRASPESTPVDLSPHSVLAGICDQSGWMAPGIVPHEVEQAMCPVHNVKHHH